MPTNTRNSETAWKYRVPFYLYLPPAYRVDTVNDHDRFGSHRDIFPTIYNRIFADMAYYDLGVDLLAADFNHERAFSMNDRFAMSSDGGIYDEDGTRILYHWKDDRYYLLKTTESPSAGLQRLASLENAYTSLIRAFTRMQIDAREAQN